jgi:hypothetical protein
MTQEHPITPPPELVQQWHNEWRDGTFIGLENYIATQAARWGADAELEACVEWLGDAPVTWNGDEQIHPGSYLRAARRPKPLSLKEQALEQLECVNGILRNQGMIKTDTIRRALESLPD